MKRGLLLGVPLLAACTAIPAPGIAVTGEWGGAHVRLGLTSTGGTLDYDCAAGTMSRPLVIDANGRFIADGTHTPAHGGPDIQGAPTPTYHVRYSGIIRGNTMTLQGRVANGALLGPSTLRRGAQPMIFRCL